MTKDYSFYLEGTNGKGVLLVHGLTGAPPEMKFIGKQLHKRGFTVYAPTLAGHCLDEGALLATCFEDWLESLRLALNNFKQDVDEVNAAGICVGGGLALALAGQESAIRRVAIYSAALDYDGWNQPKWSRLARMFHEVLVHVPAMRDRNFEEAHPFGIKSDRIRNAGMRLPSGFYKPVAA